MKEKPYSIIWINYEWALQHLTRLRLPLRVVASLLWPWGKQGECVRSALFAVYFDYKKIVKYLEVQGIYWKLISKCRQYSPCEQQCQLFFVSYVIHEWKSARRTKVAGQWPKQLSLEWGELRALAVICSCLCVCSDHSYLWHTDRMSFVPDQVR